MKYKGVRAAIAVPAVVASVTVMSVGAIALAEGPDKGGVPGDAAVSPATHTAFSNCRTHLSDFITNSATSLGTTSTSYVPVPLMTKTIRQGTTTSGCVIVTASSFSFADENALQYVRVTLDGVAAQPVEVQWSGDDDEDGDGRWAREHAAVFAFPSVSPGSHTVRLEHRSSDGKRVVMHRPAMHIQHK